eukprot:TRINITY_DN4436_c0_g1_i1.p1 TRINITY_DN4436_c0_g1~~TRINITY_DN4436_c0_g1_i1.p1  ORF type:complete len:124 (+),score=16.76 TRINITY_DN4436_c0_g1_i1:47-418(+)
MRRVWRSGVRTLGIRASVVRGGGHLHHEPEIEVGRDGIVVGRMPFDSSHVVFDHRIHELEHYREHTHQYFEWTTKNTLLVCAFAGSIYGIFKFFVWSQHLHDDDPLFRVQNRSHRPNSKYFGD